VIVIVFGCITAGAAVVAFFHLWRLLGDVLDKKNVNPIWLQLLLLVLFPGGGVGGFALPGGFTGEPRGGNYNACIAGAFFGLVIGTGLPFLIAFLIPDYRGESTLGKHDFEMSRRTEHHEADEDFDIEDARRRRRHKKEKEEQERVRAAEEARRRKEREEQQREREQEELRRRRDANRERGGRVERLDEIDDEDDRRRGR
jgi:hypothetical protein